MSQSPRLVLIAAVARNGVIGIENRLPWKLPEDLRHFKALTLGHPIVMGRKTWESLGRPLPGRRNLVVSRNPDFSADGAEVVAGLEQALLLCPSDETVYLIGGAELYRLGLPIADEMRLTEIDLEVDGDARFPAVRREDWIEADREHHVGANGIAFDFVTYLRQ